MLIPTFNIQLNNPIIKVILMIQLETFVSLFIDFLLFLFWLECSIEGRLY